MDSDMSPCLLPDDPCDTGLSWPSGESDDFDLEDEWWRGCPCCATFTGSFYVAEQQANHSFAADFSNESNMNAAGHTTLHPYRDLRSASYARKRSRKKFKAKPRTRSFRGRRWKHEHCERENQKRKRNSLRYEIDANQRRGRVWSPGRPKNMDIISWDVKLEEEFDQDIKDMWDDVIRYEKLHKNAEVFENPELYTETGETFSTWAQRRIAEMRAVKESRVQTSSAPRQQPMVYKKTRLIYAQLGVDRLDYTIYCGSPLTTTLPTNAHDAHGHALLRAALTPTKWAVRQARRNWKNSVFPRIQGDIWFGEYTWRWHKNASGCWEFGYGECGGGAIPCPCCNMGNGSMHFECYCEEFRDEVAPDEQQRCSLVEWVGTEGRRLIRADEAWVQSQGHTKDCNNEGSAVSDCEWSFVDEYCGVRSCPSVASSIEF